jgi:hypothetical protein
VGNSPTNASDPSGLRGDPLDIFTNDPPVWQLIGEANETERNALRDFLDQGIPPREVAGRILDGNRVVSGGHYTPAQSVVHQRTAIELAAGVLEAEVRVVQASADAASFFDPSLFSDGVSATCDMILGNYQGAATGIGIAAIPFVGKGLKNARRLAKIGHAAENVADAATAVGKVGANAGDAEGRFAKDCPAPNKTSAQLRAEWEAASNKPWPKDPVTGGNQDVSHIKPKADGGSNTLDNIEPMPHGDHMQMHIENGDFKRWGAKRGKQP